jgi:hypothetical protein
LIERGKKQVLAAGRLPRRIGSAKSLSKEERKEIASRAAKKRWEKRNQQFKEALRGMNPNLTPEQKEHIKVANRAEDRLKGAWQLFCMYLQTGQYSAREAVQMADDAMEAWMEFADFGEQMAAQLGKVFDKLTPQTPQQISNAEFINDTKEEPKS